jgi:hypothetical protein
MFGFILHFIKIMPISDGMYYSIAPLLALGIGAGAQALFGGIQAIGGARKRKELEANPYKFTIPEQAKQLLELRQAGLTGMPRQALEFERQNIERSSVMAQRAAADRRGGLATVGTTMAQRDLSLAALGARNANIAQQNINAYAGALMNMQQMKLMEEQSKGQQYANEMQMARAREGAGYQNIMRGLDLFGSAAAMGLLGSGKAPGVGGSTYNPQSQFLTGTAPGLNLRTSINPATMSLYRGPQPFNSSILRNPSGYRPNPLSSVGLTSSINQPSYTPTSMLPGYTEAMQDLFSQP